MVDGEERRRGNLPLFLTAGFPLPTYGRSRRGLSDETSKQPIFQAARDKRKKPGLRRPVTAKPGFFLHSPFEIR